MAKERHRIIRNESVFRKALEEGSTPRELALYFDCSLMTIYDTFRRFGISVRNSPGWKYAAMKADLLERALKFLRSEGYTLASIGKALGVSRQRVHQLTNDKNSS